jgi:hypothetical protein
MKHPFGSKREILQKQPRFFNKNVAPASETTERATVFLPLTGAECTATITADIRYLLLYQKGART